MDLGEVKNQKNTPPSFVFNLFLLEGLKRRKESLTLQSSMQQSDFPVLEIPDTDLPCIEFY